MSTRILKRSELAQMLRDWEEGGIPTENLMRWANGLYLSDEVDYEDWESDNSVTNEVLAALDMLHMNLALPEDASIYLVFLSTPIGQFQKGYAEYRSALDRIDYASRRTKLRDVPLYAPFLRNEPR